MSSKLLSSVTSSSLLVLTAPFIYAPIIPMIMLDLIVILYESICFPIYGIERVRRSDFTMIDRNLMTYMSTFDRFNCYYCSYFNNAISYIREVAARTEVYWCPLKEAKRRQKAHHYYEAFSPTNEEVIIPNPNANNIIKKHNQSDV